MAEIIDLQITVGDKAPEQANFGIPLIAGFHTRFPERVRTYAQAKDMKVDGFLETDAEYQAALVLKSQVPAPPLFKIGRLALATFTHTVTLAPANITEGLNYTGEINGEDASFSVPASASVALNCDALVLAATGIAGATATDNTTHVTVTGAANKVVSFANLSKHYVVEDTTVVNAANLQADLNAILEDDSSWYGLALTINSKQAIDAATAWVEANHKVMAEVSADSKVINPGVTNDVASGLVALSYTRNAGIYHPDIGGSQWANVAYLAVNLSPDPGSYTPAFKSLVGVRTVDLSAAARQALEAKNWSRYSREYGQNIIFEGKTPSGRFFDVVRFLDWLEFTIKADLHALLANNPKLGYDSKGIAAVKGCIEGSLRKGITIGGLDGVDTPPEVTVPALSATSAGDRAARLLRGISFTGRLTGALHSFIIRGDVSP